jgi:transcriptional regulator with XRE-family HTH domain
MKQRALHHAELIKQLKNARNRAGLTQQELARRLQSDQSIVAKIETGVRRIDVLEFAEICEALGVSLEEIVLPARNAVAGSPRGPDLLTTSRSGSDYAIFE